MKEQSKTGGALGKTAVRGDESVNMERVSNAKAIETSERTMN